MRIPNQANFIMLVHQSRPVILSVLLSVVLGLVVAGCSRKANPVALQARADEYFKAGKYDEAKIEYMNLLRADNRNATGYRQIGIIWYEQGAPVQAISFLLKAKELAPENLDGRTKLAYAFLSVGDLATARKEAIAIIEKAPVHEDAIMLLAETAVTKEDVEFTEEQLRKNKEPDRASVHLASAVLAGRKRDFAAAEEEVQKALALDPKLVSAHLALANLFLAKRDTVRAGEEMKKAADFAPARAPARLRLVEFKLNSGAVEEARVLLKEMTQATRDYLPAWRLLAQMAFAEKKYDESLALLENIFTRDVNNIDARLLQAQVWSAKGEPKKAVEVIERLRTAYPMLPAIGIRLAQAYVQDGNSAQAGTVLKELVAAQPDFVEAVLLLGEVNLRSGVPQAVVESMTALLKRRPRLKQAELLLADAYRALGRFDDAAEVIREQIKVNPLSGESYFMLGVILREKGSYIEARVAFEKAQEFAPDNLQATNQVVELDMLGKNFKAAHQTVDKQIQRMPNSAAAHFLSGRIYAAQREWDKAEAALLKAIELEPGSSKPYDLLIGTYIEAGKMTEAISRLEAKLVKKPNDQSALLTSAVIYEKTNEFSKARDAYEKMLVVNPDFAPALNNLAVLYTEKLNELDKAYELVRKARSLRPDDPSIADTLGWILYKRADYKGALTLFSESGRKIPDNPEIQYHLGMANHMMGQTEAARKALQQAVASPAEFPGKEEARKRLALLGSGTGKPAQLSAEELEVLVKQQPNDLVSRVGLGEAYEAQAAFQKAAAAYEEALKLNPKLLPATLNLARLNLGPLQNAAKALELAKKARSLAPNDPKAAEILGRASYQTGSFSLAYGLLQESARQPAVDAGTLHDFASVAYNMGRVTQAQDTMRRLLKEAPNSPQADDAKSFLTMTELADSEKDLAAAEPEVQKILDANPASVPALMVRAALQAQRGDSKSAEAVYAQILGRLPEFAPAQKQLAALYVADPANRDKAYGMVVKARMILPDDPGLARTLAELSYHRKDFANAIRFFEESAKKRPLDARDLFYLGMSQAQAKDKPKALDALRRALEAGLQEPMAAEARSVLSELGQ